MALYVLRLIDADGPDAKGNYTINCADGSAKTLSATIFETLFEPYSPPAPSSPPAGDSGTPGRN